MPARVAAEIAALPEPRGPMRRLCGDLARRIRLLAPLLQQLQQEQQQGPLSDALAAARDLLRSVQEGSKIYQVRELRFPSAVIAFLFPVQGMKRILPLLPGYRRCEGMPSSTALRASTARFILRWMTCLTTPSICLKKFRSRYTNSLQLSLRRPPSEPIKQFPSTMA